MAGKSDLPISIRWFLIHPAGPAVAIASSRSTGGSWIQWVRGGGEARWSFKTSQQLLIRNGWNVLCIRFFLNILGAGSSKIRRMMLKNHVAFSAQRIYRKVVSIRLIWKILVYGILAYCTHLVYGILQNYPWRLPSKQSVLPIILYYSSSWTARPRCLWIYQSCARLKKRSSTKINIRILHLWRTWWNWWIGEAQLVPFPSFSWILCLWTLKQNLLYSPFCNFSLRDPSPISL